MSKNVFAYFHKLKDVDSRNEKTLKIPLIQNFQKKQSFFKKQPCHFSQNFDPEHRAKFQKNP